MKRNILKNKVDFCKVLFDRMNEFLEISNNPNSKSPADFRYQSDEGKIHYDAFAKNPCGSTVREFEKALCEYITHNTESDFYDIDFEDTNIYFGHDGLIVCEPHGRSKNDKIGLYGINQLPSGEVFFAYMARGGEEAPLNVILYVEGTDFKLYVPEKGNNYNKKTKSAWCWDDFDDPDGSMSKFSEKDDYERFSASAELADIAHFLGGSLVKQSKNIRKNRRGRLNNISDDEGVLVVSM